MPADTRIVLLPGGEIDRENRRTGFRRLPTPGLGRSGFSRSRAMGFGKVPDGPAFRRGDPLKAASATRRPRDVFTDRSESPALQPSLVQGVLNEIGAAMQAQP